MSKELEKAIRRLNKFKTIEVLYGNTFAMHLEQLEQLQSDLDIVLQALDNSISKEVVENEIEECIRNMEEDERHDEWGYESCKIQVLKKILGEKK